MTFQFFEIHESIQSACAHRAEAGVLHYDRAYDLLVEHTNLRSRASGWRRPEPSKTGPERGLIGQVDGDCRCARSPRRLTCSGRVPGKSSAASSRGTRPRESADRREGSGSCSSREYTALGKSSVDKATAHLSPAVGVVATNDDDICRHPQIAQSPVQTNRLLCPIGDSGSTTRKSTSLCRSASPRACEPNRITCASGAAAAKRRPASSISASSITLIAEIVVAAMDRAPMSRLVVPPDPRSGA